MPRINFGASLFFSLPGKGEKAKCCSAAKIKTRIYCENVSGICE